PLVVALARDLSVRVEDDAADDRIGARGAEAACGERHGAAHGGTLMLRHCGWGGGHRVLLPLRARTPGPVDDDRIDGTTHGDRRTAARRLLRPAKPTAAHPGVLIRRALPPIRTFTVGP